MAGITTSALRHATYAMEVEERNNALSRTEGSTVKKAVVTTIVQAGKTTALRTRVERNIDQFALQTIRTYGARADYHQVIENGIKPIQDLVGTVEGGSLPKLVEPVSDFFRNVNSALQNPANPTIKSVVVGSAERLCSAISETATVCYTAKQTAQAQMVEEIASLNANIERLADINYKISQEFAAGHEIADLEDQRDQLITEISASIMLEPPMFAANHTVMLRSAGKIILYEDKYASFSYTPAQGLEPIEDGAQLGIVTYNLNFKAYGEDESKVVFTSEFYNSADQTHRLPYGRLRGLADLHDEVVPKYISALDNLAFNLRESLNKIHNSGSPYPGSSEVISSKKVTLSDKSAWTGRATIAVVDSATGRPVTTGDNGYVVSPLSLDLETLSKLSPSGTLRVQDIVDEINAHFGPKVTTSIGMGQQAGAGNKFLLGDFQLVTQGTDNGVFSFDFDALNTSDFAAKIEILGVTVDGGGANILGTLPDIATVGRGEQKRTFQTINLDTRALGVGVHDIGIRVRTVGANGQVSEGVIHFDLNFAEQFKANQRMAGRVAGDQGGFAERALDQASFLTAAVVDSEGDTVDLFTEGFLSIKTTDSKYRVVIQDDTSFTSLWADGFGAIKRGFGHYFGFNNLIDSTDKSGRYGLDMRVRSDILTSPELFSNSRLVSAAPITSTFTIGDAQASAGITFAAFGGGGVADYNAATINVMGRAYTLSAIGAPGMVNIAAAANETEVIDIVVNTLNTDSYLKNLASFSRDGNQLIITAINKGVSGNNITYAFNAGAGQPLFDMGGGFADNAAANLAGGADKQETIALPSLGLAVASSDSQIYADIAKMDQQGTNYIGSKYVNFTFGKISTLAIMACNFMTITFDKNSSDLKIQGSSLTNATDNYKRDYGYDRDAQVDKIMDLQRYKSEVGFAYATQKEMADMLIRMLSGR